MAPDPLARHRLGGRPRRRSRAGLPVEGALPPHQPPKPTRRRGTLLVLGLFVISLTAGLAAWRIVDAGVFQVETVEVVGAGMTPVEEIRAAAGIEGRQYWQVSEQPSADLLALPGVKRVQITKHWPNQVTITVEERTPAVVWRTSAADAVVDEDGVTLASPVLGGLPAVSQIDRVTALLPGERVDRETVRLVMVAGSLLASTTGMQTARLEYSDAAGLDLVTDKGMRVRLGDGQNLDFKVEILRGVLDQARRDKLTVNEVDLRHGERAAVR